MKAEPSDLRNPLNPPYQGDFDYLCDGWGRLTLSYSLTRETSDPPDERVYIASKMRERFQPPLPMIRGARGVALI